MDNILIVEDDTSLREALTRGISYNGYAVDTAASAEEAVCKIQQNTYKIILSDVKLPNMDGLSLVQKIKQEAPQSQVILMTAYGTIKDAVFAIQHGASDYISKPFEIDNVIDKFKKIISHQSANKLSIPEVDTKMREVYQLCEKVAPSDATVLLMGESGTGKEVLSKYIHEHSARNDKPFVAINCAAIPDNMLEAMLFGHEKGAFTGALKTTEGKFELANGGTLLLDEISEMPINLQAKILRVLQEKEVEKLGSKRTIPLDVRVIATTNRDLKEAVNHGAFRKDLYFRLNVFPINLPPLRERGEDVLYLANTLLKRYATNDCSISLEAQHKLKDYHWPGNVRELENIVQRAAILAQDEILPEHIIFDELGDSPKSTPQNLQDHKEHAEFFMILEVLDSFNGNRKQTSEKLGISPRTLRYKLAKMKELGIKLPN